MSAAIPGCHSEPNHVGRSSPPLASAPACPRPVFRLPGWRALETPTGAIVTGCNVENATYGLQFAPERVAIVKAISEGLSGFTRIAIVADTEAPTPPCGACRQILWEFGGDLEIILANLTEVKATYRLSQLLPLPFDGRLLGEKP